MLSHRARARSAFDLCCLAGKGCLLLYLEACNEGHLCQACSVVQDCSAECMQRSGLGNVQMRAHIKSGACALQVQTHEFNMPFQLAHPDHVPETDVPDQAQVPASLHSRYASLTL